MLPFTAAGLPEVVTELNTAKGCHELNLLSFSPHLYFCMNIS